MHPNCEECQRLWSEYAKATRSLIALDSKLRLEALIDDHGEIAAVTRCVESAERDRAEAREAIGRHDATWEAAESLHVDHVNVMAEWAEYRKRKHATATQH